MATKKYESACAENRGQSEASEESKKMEEEKKTTQVKKNNVDEKNVTEPKTRKKSTKTRGKKTSEASEIIRRRKKWQQKVRKCKCQKNGGLQRRKDGNRKKNTISGTK